VHEAILWETEGDRIRCAVCPHRCRIADGHVGVCGVRENQGGVLWALTYARVSSACADPIEKKPVFHYRPGTLAFSLGSVGCTMKCGHCQNWTISRAHIVDEDVANGLATLPPERVPGLAGKADCEGVAFTYNEPVIWIEYVRDVSRLAHEAGLYTVMVTNGFITTEGLDALAGLIDVWRVDVKGFNDETYRSLCRVPSVVPVLAAAERAKVVHGMHVEVVTNVVPTVNDDDAQLGGIARWIAEALGADTPWHITRFFPYLDYADLPPTPPATLHRAVEFGREAGLNFVYLGNVNEPEGEDTTCPGCGTTVVRRDGYRVVEKRTEDGCCAVCGRPLGLVE
jgi:pyruvate formate lyase activating enzyme